MYKVVIVEDDVFYRHEIRHFINWERHGFTIAGEAVNGKHALEIIKQEVPDILLTDISMPEMNGIELLKTVKQEYPRIKCIVLSSYDDFSFVKDALKLGAEDYILKYDLKEQEVAAVLEKVKKEITESRKAEKKNIFLDKNFTLVSEEFLKKLILGHKVGQEDMRAFWESYGIIERPGNFTVLALKFAGRETHEKAGEMLRSALLSEEFAVSMDEYTHAVLLSRKKENSTILILEYVTGKVTGIYRLLRENGINDFSIGVSDSAREPEKIGSLFMQAEAAAAQSLYEGYGKVFFYANLNKGTEEADIEVSTEELMNDIHEGQIERAQEKLKRKMASFYAARPEKQRLQKEFMDLADAFYRICIVEEISVGSILGIDRITEKWCAGFHTMQEMEEVLMKGLDRLAAKMEERDQLSTGMGNRQVYMAIHYIEKNYMKEMSLEILSRELGLTPNYLCKIFKNNTGMKLTQFINQVRVEGAKKLMRQTNMRANEIAETVGFSSASYFSTIFKQVTGITVSEYKESLFKKQDSILQGKPFF